MLVYSCLCHHRPLFSLFFYRKIYKRTKSLLAAKTSLGAPVTNWEPHGVTLAAYGYAVRHGMKFQLVTPYRVSHLQRYGVTVRGNGTSVDPPVGRPFVPHNLMSRS